MVSASAFDSISPVARLGFLWPPRSTTTPATPMQNSPRSSPARPCAWALVPGSNTTWVRPPRSRRSMNTHPPWSRRDATQPNSTARLPASLARSAPQSCVRLRSIRNSDMHGMYQRSAGGHRNALRVPTYVVAWRSERHADTFETHASTRPLPRQLLGRLQLRGRVHALLSRKDRRDAGRGLIPAAGAQGFTAAVFARPFRRRRERMRRFSLLAGPTPDLVVRPPRVRVPAAGRRGPFPRRRHRTQVL